MKRLNMMKNRVLNKATLITDEKHQSKRGWFFYPRVTPLNRSMKTFFASEYISALSIEQLKKKT